MGAAQLLQLDAVLEHAQLLVVAAERFGVGAADVADRGQCRQGIHGGFGTHGGVGSTVHELQQLHGELDIAQAARAQLNLAVHLVRGDIVGHAGAHRLHGFHEGFTGGRLPHEGVNRAGVAGAQLRRTGDGASLEQCLELPVFGPTLVVLNVGFDGAHERAVLAFGAQVRVDLPEGGFGRGAHDGAGEGVHEFRADGGTFVLGELERGALSLCPGTGRGASGGGFHGCNHVHYINVRDVVQLAGTALTHADNRQVQGVYGFASARSRQAGAQPLRNFGAGNGERALQRGGSQIGEVTTDGGHDFDRVFAAHVEQGDARQGGAIGDAQGHVAVLAGLLCGSARTLRVGVRAEGGEDIAAVWGVQRSDGGQKFPVGFRQNRRRVLGANQRAFRRVHLRVEERVNELGAAVEEITNRLGCTEQAVHAEFFLAAVGALGDRRVLFDEAHEGGQRNIRGGCKAQPGKERILRNALQFGRVEPAFRLGRVVKTGGNHAGVQAQLGFAFGFGALLVVERIGGDVGQRLGFFGGVNNADEPGSRVVRAVSHSVRTVGRTVGREYKFRRDKKRCRYTCGRYPPACYRSRVPP